MGGVLNSYLNAFIQDKIDDNRVQNYVETLIALDLYLFDESSDHTHDLICNIVFTLDELHDVNGTITKEDAQKLLNQIIAITQ